MPNLMHCPRCQGTSLIPVPSGMSYGFYRFMGAWCVRSENGTMWMSCPRCDTRRDEGDITQPQDLTKEHVQ